MSELLSSIYSSRILPKIYSSYEKNWLDLTQRFQIGKNIFEEEWDLLLVLDTCRVDALEELREEYDMLNDIGQIWSLGSSTPEWTMKTFNQEFKNEIKNTSYLISSGYAGYVLKDRIFHPNKNIELKSEWGVANHHDFKYYEETWNVGEQVDGFPKPSNTTERAIDVGRKINSDRTIVHYFSPHSPFTYREIKYDEDMTDIERHPFDKLRAGEDVKEAIWNAYIEQLRLVLDSVEDLLSNFDAEKVIITSDHGEAFGEMGLIEHRAGMLHPAVKKVPWVEVTATDEETITPQSEKASREERNLDDIKSSLQDLGYL